MRVLFFSRTCGFCNKLIEYIDKNNLSDYFKLICIDDTIDLPKNITIVPTIVSQDIEAPLEGKKAFEYVINQKYFNHPTNNIEYTKLGVPKPSIEEDQKANTTRSTNGFLYVDKDTEKRYTDKEEKHNFDRVFVNQNYNQLNSYNNTYAYQYQHEVQNKQQPKQMTESDHKLSELMTQRNMQDKKMQALMRLRK